MREIGGTMLDWVYEDLGVGRAYVLELLRCSPDQTRGSFDRNPVAAKWRTLIFATSSSQ